MCDGGGLSCACTQLCWPLEGRCTSSLLQGHPPSLRFGHPDVATDGTDASARIRFANRQNAKRRQPPPPHPQNTKPPSNTLNRDSLPRHSSLGTGRTQNHRESTATPTGLARGSAPSSLLQGHPPSLRFGHPDVATEATETSTHPPEVAYRCAHREPLGAATFSGSALRVSHGRSPQRSKERAERPGDGCPCVGAEETCSAPRSLGRREVPTHPTPVGTRANTVFRARPSATKEISTLPNPQNCIYEGTQKSRRFRRISGIFFEVRPLGLEPRTH